MIRSGQVQESRARKEFEDKKERHQREIRALYNLKKRGAVDYVQRIVEKAKRKGGRTVLRLETGRGNNSRDNVPAIKVALQTTYKDLEFCRIELEKGNDGLLKLTVF